jgi:hypothetical protein
LGVCLAVAVKIRKQTAAPGTTDALQIRFTADLRANGGQWLRDIDHQCVTRRLERRGAARGNVT